MWSGTRAADSRPATRASHCAGRDITDGAGRGVTSRPAGAQRVIEIARDVLVVTRFDDERHVRVRPAPGEAPRLAVDGQTGQEHEQCRQQRGHRVAAQDGRDRGPPAPIGRR